jgi:FAD/FMN-containing dehydrogenase
MPETIDQLKTALRGDLIQPSNAAYDASRKVHNGMSIRGGGHNAGGLGVCDGGLVIDLSRMHGVRVDPGARTVRAEGGCVWGDVDHATHAFGMATPSGIISTTGVGGLTLGGGLGHLSRKCGLSIDNLLAVDMVLADGRFVTPAAEVCPHPALYCARRARGKVEPSH